MMLEHMSKEDIACVREFMASGNGLAMFEYADENVSAFASADEYVAHMKQAADAGCHLASEALAYLYEDGGLPSADRSGFRVEKDEESSLKYREMAKALKRQWDASNAGRVLVCDFYGFAQFRCGDEIFEDSYIYPSFPLDMLRMCIRKIEEGALISEWFCDEEIRYEVSEKVVNGVERLFIRWNDLGNVNHCEEFPGYVFSAFATKIADDIEADYFGWAYFMGSCDGIGISEDLESLKECVAKLRSLLLSVKS